MYESLDSKCVYFPEEVILPLKLVELIFRNLVEGKLHLDIKFNNFDTRCGLDGIHEAYTQLQDALYSFGNSHKGSFVYINKNEETYKNGFEKCIAWITEFLSKKFFSIIPFDANGETKKKI